LCFYLTLTAYYVYFLQYIPTKTKQLFTENSYVNNEDGNNNTNSSTNSTPIRIVHSSDTSNFKDDVYQKNVVIIGGGLSAEDLTLMAIKEGANHIYITCRGEESSESAEGTVVSRWPYDKVTTHRETCVTNVSVSNEITLTKVERCSIKRKYVLWDDEDYEKADEVPIVLNNVDTVIFCTGYEPNFNMLDDDLHPFSKNKESRHGDNMPKFNVPKNWTMHPSTTNDDDGDNKMNEGKDEDDNDDDDASSSSESSSSSSSSSDDDDEEDYDYEEYLESLYHKLSKLYFGENYKQIENNIIPSSSSSDCDDSGSGSGGIFVYGPYGANHPHTLYRGIFSIPNPNMMYIVNQETDGPLMETDVTSWIIAKVITTSSSFSKKQHALPKTKQDMINENLGVNLGFMKSPFARYQMDLSYVNAINKTYDPETDMHPKEEQIEKAYEKVHEEEYYYSYFLLGQYMIEYNYPISFIQVYTGGGNENSETKTMKPTRGEKISYCWSNYFKTIVLKGGAECDISRCHVDKYHNHGSNNENENNNNKVPFWRTFRDHPNTDNFVSHFTGVKAIPLGPTKWFDLNEDDKLW
jgi:hypothetical protein